MIMNLSMAVIHAETLRRWGAKHKLPAHVESGTEEIWLGNSQESMMIGIIIMCFRIHWRIEPSMEGNLAGVHWSSRCCKRMMVICNACCRVQRWRSQVEVIRDVPLCMSSLQSSSSSHCSFCMHCRGTIALPTSQPLPYSFILYPVIIRLWKFYHQQLHFSLNFSFCKFAHPKYM